MATTGESRQGQGESGDGDPGESSYDAVPTDLTDRDRWMLYDTSAETERRPFGWDNGRLDKGASWKNDDDLLSFAEAREAAASKETYGIGYVLHDDDPFVAIDIDGGIDDGGQGKEWLPKLAPFLGDTYTDLSPSGTGIHLWYRGDIPEWWEDKHVTDGEHEGVEAFDDRFVTVTGDRPPAPWGDRADTIAPIDDAAAEWFRGAWGNLADESDDSAPWNQEPDARTPGESRPNPVPSGGNGPGGDWFGEAEAVEALDHINRSVPYPEWMRLCFALKDQFGGHRAKRLFTEWSRQGSKWDEHSGPQVDEFIERDAPAGKKVEIGYLIDKAKAGGWTPAPVEGWPAYYDDHDEPPANYGRGLPWGAVKGAYLDDDTARKTARTRAVEKLLSDHDYATPRDTGTIWVYHPGEGIYDRAGESHIQETIEKHLGPLVDNNEAKQIVEKVNRRSRINREAFGESGRDAPLLCVKNGVLNLATRELHPHSAEYMFKTRIPVEYDPEADGQVIRAFLNDVTAREADAKTLEELAGLCLWPNHDIRAAFGMLIGDGANGKGVFETLLTEFLGPENVAGVDLHTLSSNRFAVARLENKFANVGADISGAKVNDLSVVKSITGGDRLHVERKYESGYEAKIAATPIFSVNQPPTFGEKDHALARRIVPVEFPYTFSFNPDDGQKQAEPKAKVMDRLASDEALSGFLNLALEGLARVAERGDFSLPEGPAERLERYEKEADPIAAFAGECVENRQGAYVTTAAAYETYREYCRQNDKEPKTKATFYRELRRADEIAVAKTRFRLGEFGKGDRARVLKDTFFTAKGRDLCPKPNWKQTKAVNEKRGAFPWREGDESAGIDTENPENRSVGQKEITGDIRRAAAFGDGATPFDELATFVAENMDHAKADVEYWIDHMENTGELTKVPGGYDAPEKADLTEL